MDGRFRKKRAIESQICYNNTSVMENFNKV